MWVIKFLWLGLIALSVSGCMPNMFWAGGKDITEIIVMKEQRRLYLMHKKTVLKTYKIDLGFNPRGHKAIEGDGKTPEGRYVINRYNPDSEFHLS